MFIQNVDPFIARVRSLLTPVCGKEATERLIAPLVSAMGDEVDKAIKAIKTLPSSHVS